jgi:hypothetical protein
VYVYKVIIPFKEVPDQRTLNDRKASGCFLAGTWKELPQQEQALTNPGREDVVHQPIIVELSPDAAAERRRCLPHIERFER